MNCISDENGMSAELLGSVLSYSFMQSGFLCCMCLVILALLACFIIFNVKQPLFILTGKICSKQCYQRPNITRVQFSKCFIKSKICNVGRIGQQPIRTSAGFTRHMLEHQLCEGVMLYVVYRCCMLSCHFKNVYSFLTQPCSLTILYSCKHFFFFFPWGKEQTLKETNFPRCSKVQAGSSHIPMLSILETKKL